MAQIELDVETELDNRINEVLGKNLQVMHKGPKYKPRLKPFKVLDEALASRRLRNNEIEIIDDILPKLV